MRFDPGTVIMLVTAGIIVSVEPRALPFTLFLSTSLILPLILSPLVSTLFFLFSLSSITLGFSLYLFLRL